MGSPIVSSSPAVVPPPGTSQVPVPTTRPALPPAAQGTTPALASGGAAGVASALLAANACGAPPAVLPSPPQLPAEDIGNVPPGMVGVYVGPAGVRTGPHSKPPVGWRPYPDLPYPHPPWIPEGATITPENPFPGWTRTSDGGFRTNIPREDIDLPAAAG